jgi:hypothetical protein
VFFRTTLAVTLLLSVRAASAAPAVVVATGDRWPAGGTFSSLSDAALDDRGRVAFIGASTAAFRRGVDGIVHFAAAGHPLGPSGVVAGVGPPALGPSGCVAFRAFFVGGGDGIFEQCGTGLRTIARAGDAAPGGERFVAFAPGVALGAGGTVAFEGRLDSGMTALFAATDHLVELVRLGDPSPRGGSFSGFRLLGVSGSGRIGFRASATGGPDGLFYADGTNIVPLVGVNDASPAGGRFTSVGLGTVNDGDVWTFRATLSTGASGVFRTDTSPIVPRTQAVVLAGDGTPVGGTFRDFPTSLAPTISTSGTIAFRATLRGVAFGAGVFLAPAAGGIVKVVAAGEGTAVGQLTRLRDPAIADDLSVLVPASLAGGGSGLFVVRNGMVTPLARLGDPTTVGSGYRFSGASVRGRAEDAAFLGQREGVFVADASSGIDALAVLGDPTPLGGTYADFDQPSAGPGERIVFRADIHGGRAKEAYFVTGRHGLEALVSSGEAASRCGKFVDFSSGALDGSSHASVGRGGIAFYAEVGGSSPANGVFMKGMRRVRALACQGDRAPGGGRFAAFGSPSAAPGARIAFVAALNDTSAGQGLFLRRGRLRALAREGEQTRTRLAGRFERFDPPAASAGGVAFHALLQQPAGEGIFFVAGGRTQALLANGDEAPAAATFVGFDAPAIAGGQVVFNAQVSGGVAGLFRAPLVPSGAAAVETLARLGDDAPLDATYVGFGSPSGNPGGSVAVTCDLAGGRAASAVLVFAAP